MHSAQCWSEMMCVPCERNKLILMTAERDGLAIKLLEVQQDYVDFISLLGHYAAAISTIVKEGAKPCKACNGSEIACNSLPPHVPSADCNAPCPSCCE